MTAIDSKTKRSTTFKLMELGLMSAINLLLMVVMHNFEEIYRDALPGRPLPSITTFILDYRIFLGLVASAWLIAGIVFVRKGDRFAILVIHCGMLWCILQAGLTVYGLFAPMLGLSIRMSDATR